MTDETYTIRFLDPQDPRGVAMIDTIGDYFSDDMRGLLDATGFFMSFSALAAADTEMGLEAFLQVASLFYLEAQEALQGDDDANAPAEATDTE